jgi:hypothetical protein
MMSMPSVTAWTALENDEGGGPALVQIDWAAVSGPASILNKPPLGSSASRNVGATAADVAAGDHGHSISQIAGLDTALAGKATASHGHPMGDVTGLSSALAAKADLSNGKIPVSQIPAIAISEFLGPVNSQAAMLALNGERGDWCARTDLGKAFIVTAEPSSLIANWFEWIYPVSPVISVAGRAGAVTLSTSDLTDSSAIGRAIVTALDAASARSALGLGALSTLTMVGTAQIDDAAVSNAKLASMAAATLKGSIGGGTPADLTATQVTALLNVFTSALKGLVPPSGGGTTTFLRADGTFAAPPGGSPAGSGSELQFRNGGAFGAVTGSSSSGGNIVLNGNLNCNFINAANNVIAGSFEVINVITINNATWGNRMGSGFVWAWSSGTTPYASPDLSIRRRAAANFCLGAIDAASPVAQTLSVQSATGTNSSAAAAVFSLDGAQGTGTGAGGDVRIRVAPNGSTGSTQNALIEAVRFRATDLATVCAGAVIVGGPVVYPSFTVATVPSPSLWARGHIWVADDVGGPTLASCDGTNWRRVADRAVVSTP